MTMGRLAGLVLTVLCGAAGMTQPPLLPASCEKQAGEDDEYSSTRPHRRSRNQASDHDDMAEILMSGV